MASNMKKRWFSFSLKTLFTVMTVLAVLLGLFVKSVRDRMAAFAAIEDLKGSISYKQSSPNWLRAFVSDEKYFWNPVAVRFSPNDPITDAELQAVMKHLMNFDDLTYVNFYESQITDVGLAELLPLAHKLESLDIRGTKVSDGGIATLKQLSRLTLLRLTNSSISNDGIDEIRNALPNCKLEVQ